MFASSATSTLTEPLGAIAGRGFVDAGVGWGGGFVGGCLCPGLPPMEDNGRAKTPKHERNGTR